MFLIQKTDYDCAPITIINYMQYLGQPWSARQLPDLRYILNTKKTGTHIVDLMFAFEALMPRTQIGLTRSAKRVISYMKNKGPVVIAYTMPNGDDVLQHVAFCYYDKGVVVTNATIGRKFVKLTEDQFGRLMTKSLNEPAIIYLKE